MPSSIQKIYLDIVFKKCQVTCTKININYLLVLFEIRFDKHLPSELTQLSAPSPSFVILMKSSMTNFR